MKIFFTRVDGGEALVTRDGWEAWVFRDCARESWRFSSTKNIVGFILNWRLNRARQRFLDKQPWQRPMLPVMVVRR